MRLVGTNRSERIRIDHLALALGLALCPAVLSCGDDAGRAGGDEDAGEGDGPAEARRMVLQSIAENVVLPTYRDFDEAAGELETAARAHADSLSDGDRTAVRDAWREAIDIWQRAELMQVGPAGLSGTELGSVAGGQDLRDEIYTWPLTNGCLIDVALAEESYADADAFAAEAVSVRGLDAMEYLLFREELANSCAARHPINGEGTWDALSEAEIQQRRADYAVTVAVLVARSARALVDAWSPEGDDFVGELSRAGAGSETYATGQEALNAVSGAMFYIDSETKDMKLADPAGISDSCAVAVCPDKLESQWAHRSKEHVANNLRGFQQLLVGGPADEDGLGFDDLLEEMGAADLAQRLRADTQTAIETTLAVEGTFAEALESDREAVVEVHAAVKAITDNFKSQFISVLDLELPAMTESDND